MEITETPGSGKKKKKRKKRMDSSWKYEVLKEFGQRRQYGGHMPDVEDVHSTMLEPIRMLAVRKLHCLSQFQQI